MDSYPYRGLLYSFLFAVGTLVGPAQAWDWQPQPSKADLLVVSAHPDDEGIFFGGVLPYYTRVQQRPTVLIDMISQGKNEYNYIRETELRDAAWTYGLRNEPIFARFPGYIINQYGGREYIETLENNWDAWDGDPSDGAVDNNGNGIPDGRESGALYLAEQIRRYKPAVIVTHDFDGEYGHASHKGTAWVAADAFSLAANTSVDIAGLPAWQADKLYIHQSGDKWNSAYGQNELGTEGVTFENWLFHDFWQEVSIDTDDDGTPDKTPNQVAYDGIQCHVSQGGPFGVSSVYPSPDEHPFHDGHHSEWWGLLASTVGPDTMADPFTIMGYDYTEWDHGAGWARGDFFEHVMPEPGTIPGDANGDGKVNDADASILATHWQQTGMRWGDGDFDNDQVVSDEDASILAAHWQEGAEGAAPVPEPSLLVSLTGALIVLVLGRRRARR